MTIELHERSWYKGETKITELPVGYSEISSSGIIDGRGAIFTVDSPDSISHHMFDRRFGYDKVRPYQKRTINGLPIRHKIGLFGDLIGKKRKLVWKPTEETIMQEVTLQEGTQPKTIYR